MQITGHIIKDRMDMLKEQGKAVDTQFKPSLTRFRDERKPDPRELMKQYEVIERKIAALQELQDRFNLRVKVEFEGGQITLARAIKLFGVLGRVKNQWKSAAEPDPYSTRYGTRSRNKDEEHPEQAVTAEEALELVSQASAKILELKQAIRKANATPVEFSDVPAGLFED